MHDCDDCEDEHTSSHRHKNKDWDMVMRVIRGVVSLGVVLILGAYGYIWNESKAQFEEKHEWRQEHQRVLDKRLDELKHGQEKIEDIVNKNIDDTRFMLQRILDEQKRTNDTIKGSDKHNR